MHDIVKFGSGFYGLKVNSTGEIIDAALIPWDGKRGTGGHPVTPGSSFEYYQNAAGTVYYTDNGGKNARVWCSGTRLRSHCHHLEQIAARR